MSTTKANEFNHRVKIFLPLFYFKVWGDEVFNTITDAVRDLSPSSFQIRETSDGVYLYLFSSKQFPFVPAKTETPDGKLWLSASEGWKIEWTQKTRSPIVTLH